MECPHLISDCKINRIFVKTKKCQLIDKCNSTTNNNNSDNTTEQTGATSTTSSIIGQNNEISTPNVTVGNTASLTVNGNNQPKYWKCGVDECDSKNNWMCLNCGIILCSRYEKGHALNHFNTMNHKTCMSILDCSVYCYKCDNFIINSTPQLEEIRQYLANEDDTKSETSSNTEESISISGSSIKSNNSNASISSNDSGWDVQLQIDTSYWLRPRKRTNSNDSSNEINNKKGRKVQRKSVKNDEITNINKNNSNGSQSTSGTTDNQSNKNFRRFVGLRNMGKTCFMNSVLQSLSNIEEFSCYICSLPSLEKEGDNNVTKYKQRVYHSRSMKENYDDAMILKDLRRLLIDLGKGSNGKAVTPEYLLRWNFPQFYIDNQNDAHEFLRCMLDRLHNELQHLPNNIELNNTINSKLNSTKDNNGCANNNGSSGGNNINCNNNSGIYNYKGSKSSIVTNVFGGILQNEVRCLICGMESRKHDPFLDLSLDIPEKFWQDCVTTNSDNNSKNANETNPICNLKDCISSFMEVEELNVGELYYCNSCKCKQKSTKRFCIRRLPNVLCLHIKRFRYNIQTRFHKIDLKISFPLKALDMSQYVLNNCTETRRNSQTNNIYDLGAVIVHHGKMANVGHYTAYAINNGTWLHFNDHTVKEVLSSEVAECKPYMLFYIRRDPSNINNNNNNNNSNNNNNNNSPSSTTTSTTTSTTSSSSSSSTSTSTSSSQHSSPPLNQKTTSLISDKLSSDIIDGNNSNLTEKTITSTVATTVPNCSNNSTL